MSELHPSIVALVALAANIAAKHPKQGLCQLDKLREYGVPEAHIDTVIEIARHIRDEAGQLLDASFDAARAAAQTQVAEAAPAGKPKVAKGKPLTIAIAEAGGACCTPTPGGKSCC
ncbi:hypothetical protein EDC61_10882 [Sulfuritortus calidifontis]|uniref:Uncharacterized protein n=1 Tax=Sulfuritortus calidifontis TaxID=1914471 RepID=A0A4R3JV60_9PROT|nr:hypothetical protein [Sulfuritortus calidifontis]TCS71739.1 hypothetical protein EDC61_10882 [Sulfuritortus calidifontis]